MQQQRVSTKELAQDEDEEEEEDEDEEPKLEARRGGPAVIKFHENEPATAPPSKKRSSEPKISLGKTNYKLPSPSLLAAPSAARKWMSPS